MYLYVYMYFSCRFSVYLYVPQRCLAGRRYGYKGGYNEKTQKQRKILLAQKGNKWYTHLVKRTG